METTSAHAARELKRRYDLLLGVGKGAFLRSPYAITAVDVHAAKLFRISSVHARVPSYALTTGRADGGSTTRTCSSSRRARASTARAG